MKKSITILCILTSFFYCQLMADPIITFFIEPYPNLEPIANSEPDGPDLQQPRKIAKYALRTQLPSEQINAGIFATYAGYITATDITGQISFPLVQTQPAVNLLITPSIKPIIMIGRTVSHWELEPHAPAALYHIARKSYIVEEPEKVEAFYWETTKLDLPKDKRIPIETIVLFEKPNHIYVPALEGVVPADKNPNMILPTIFIKKHTSKLDTALEVLGVRHFFAGLSKLYKQEPQRLMSQISKFRE